MSKIVMKREPKDNKYLHRDFHMSLDNGLSYMGKNYGDEAVIELIYKFTKAYYTPLFNDFERSGLVAIKEWIEKTYEKEEAIDAVSVEMGEKELRVKVNYCPAVRYMRECGYKPSKWYIEMTRTVNKVIAETCGIKFIMGEYDELTGETDYKFLLE